MSGVVSMNATPKLPRRAVTTIGCPVHHPEIGECWAGCLPERVEFQAASHALNQYWLDRKRGMKRWSERRLRTS